MFDSADVVFAWAIGKALLIVIVSVGALIYVAWVVTRKKEIAPRVEILKNGALRSSAAKASNLPFSGAGQTGAAEGARHILSGTSREENNTRNRSNPRPQLSVHREQSDSRAQRIARS